MQRPLNSGNTPTSSGPKGSLGHEGGSPLRT
jgi:hypothetical protein